MKKFNIVAGIIKKNDLFYVAQRKQDSNPQELASHWEFVGGKVESGETDQEALIREIKEEINCDAIIHNLIDDHIYETDTYQVHIRTYMVEITHGVVKSSVHQNEKWINIEEFNQLNFCLADYSTINKLIKINSLI